MRARVSAVGACVSVPSTIKRIGGAPCGRCPTVGASRSLLLSRRPPPPLHPRPAPPGRGPRGHAPGGHHATSGPAVVPTAPPHTAPARAGTRCSPAGAPSIVPALHARFVALAFV